MAQSANTANDVDACQETLTVDNKDVVETAMGATLSPVYKRPKDDPSPAPPNPTSRIKLSEAEVRSLIIEIFTNIGEDKITAALEAVQDRSDVFAVKQWLDENYDGVQQLKDEWQKHLSRVAGVDDAEQKADEEAADTDAEPKEESAGDKGTFPVQVFVRLRPLIRSEIEAEHKEMVYDTKNLKSKTTTMIIEDSTARNVRRPAIRKSKAKGKGKGKDAGKKAVKLKKFKGFRRVLSAEVDNHATFERCIMPSIGSLVEGRTVCVFAYGHTGSGKTHTIMGYDKQECPGMYRLTAGYIDAKLKELNADIEDEQDQLLLSCRFAELYQGKMRDLFGNLVECHVREDMKGNVVIRGTTLKDEETGQVKVAPLTPCEVRSGEIDKFLERVTSALTLRKQGSSAVHDESSRSHVFLDMELVSRRVMQARARLWDAEATLVPLGKAQTDHRIATSAFVTGFIKYDADTKEWKLNEEWKENPEHKRKSQQLAHEFLEVSLQMKEAERALRKVREAAHVAVGGKVVFVDLAGNEWGCDNKHIKNDGAVQQRERQEINKSLLALKECVRAMNGNQPRAHIPFRGSKLTMVLRPHLKAESSTAIMIANVSPSQEHIKKTFNTLSYSALVAKA